MLNAGSLVMEDVTSTLDRPPGESSVGALGCFAQKRAVEEHCDFCALPRALPDFQITDAEWENLSLPINLAFFFHNGNTGETVAMYPSPAGAMKSLLPLASWKGFAEKNPPVAEMEPDTEESADLLAV
jgi:hypothetical protein